jgi:hypothetical protein
MEWIGCVSQLCGRSQGVWITEPTIQKISNNLEGVMESQIVDPCVLSEVLSSYSEEELKRWGCRDCKTLEVKIEGMKRVFKLRFDVLMDAEGVSLLFCDPDGNIASRLWAKMQLQKEDWLTITYTVFGHPGSGPDSCQVRAPNGVYLSVNLYSLAT